jgi:hypothetical protein
VLVAADVPIATMQVHLLEARQLAISQRKAVALPVASFVQPLNREYKRARLDEYRDGIRVLSSEEQLLLREWAHWINNEFRSIINAFARAAARWPHPEVKIEGRDGDLA